MTGPAPAHPVSGIDHCFATVHDLDRAAAQYRALGFTLSPRAFHSAAKGSANHTIMFRNDYFELLGLVAETEGNANRRAVLQRSGEGLHAIACRVGDAGVAAASLAKLGIGLRGGPDHFERPVDLPDGSIGRAAFSTLVFDPAEVPIGTVFMCQHHTPEVVWLPGLLQHRNSATGLGAILAISDDPARDAARFARLWAAGQVHSRGSGKAVVTGEASALLILQTAAEMQRAYPAADLDQTEKGGFTALRITVADVNAARACLEDAGLAAFDSPTGVYVGPQDAAGVLVEFTPA